MLQSSTEDILTDKEGIADALCQYWGRIMSPTPATDRQRREYLSNMTERWRGVASKLWKDPDLNMVLLALRELDPSSSPGHDGFTGAFYKQYSTYFALVILDIIREVGDSGRLPESWSEGMTRCVPKEQGCIAVDKQRPITLLSYKITWLTGVLKLALNNLVSFVVP